MKNQDQKKEIFTDKGFWNKVRKYAGKIGCPLLCRALTLFYTFKDDKTPRWAKTTILGALGYFVSLIDAVPDIIPVVGYTDDLGVIATAIGIVAFYVTDEHKLKADQTVKKLLKDCDCSQVPLQEST